VLVVIDHQEDFLGKAGWIKPMVEHLSRGQHTTSGISLTPLMARSNFMDNKSECSADTDARMAARITESSSI
jgi:hypothetical protein